MKSANRSDQQQLSRTITLVLLTLYGPVARIGAGIHVIIGGTAGTSR